jgi:type IV fimbrial biogenesis protein FimT
MELMNIVTPKNWRHLQKNHPNKIFALQKTIPSFCNTVRNTNIRHLRKKSFGFTLLSLLTALAVSGVLLSSGIPAISHTYFNLQANSSYEELFTLIQFTRLQAVSYHSQVLLCPTIDNINCINDWSQRLMIFVDTNDDEIHNATEELLRIKTKLNKDETIKWNASGSRRYLRFKADGSTGNQNGRLSYCLIKNEELYAKQIIMTMAGRARRGSQEKAIEKCNS